LFADLAVLSGLVGDVGEVVTPSGGRWLSALVTASDGGKPCRILAQGRRVAGREPHAFDGKMVD